MSVGDRQRAGGNTLGVTPRDLKESEFHRIADELGNKKIDLLLIHVAEGSSATPYSVRDWRTRLMKWHWPSRTISKNLGTCIAGKNTIAFVFAESRGKGAGHPELADNLGTTEEQGKAAKTLGCNAT